MGPRMHYAWVITLTGVLVLLVAHGFGRMSYSVILPFMKDGLSLTYTQVGLIATGNFIGYLLSTTGSGFLATRFGPRRIISLSLMITGVSLFLTGFSDSFLFAFLTRLIAGAGNGGCFVPMMSLPAAWFVARKRGLAIGIVNMGVGIGLSAAGLLLPYCINYYGPEGWRYAWYLMGIAVFATSFIAYTLLRDDPHEKGLTAYGDGPGSSTTRGQVTLLSAFYQVLGQKEIWKLGCVYFMYGFSYMIYLTFFVAYLTKEIGMDAAQAGRIFAVIGLVGIFGGILSGGISDLIGRKYACLCIYLVLALSYVLLAFWKGNVSFYLSAIMFGMAAFSVPVLMAAAAGDAVGGRLAPAALGIITLLFAVAQMFAPFVGGWIKDTTGTFIYAFALCTAIALLGALCSLLLRGRSVGQTPVSDQ
jgi:sugar phosphate permease